jgi:hypothetical protein
MLFDLLSFLLNLLKPSDVTTDYNKLAVAVDQLSLDLYVPFAGPNDLGCRQRRGRIPALLTLEYHWVLRAVQGADNTVEVVPEVLSIFFRSLKLACIIVLCMPLELFELSHKERVILLVL